MKRIINSSIAILMIIITLTSTVPVKAFMRSGFPANSKLYAGGCFVLYSGDVCLCADISSGVAGVCSVALPESENAVADDAKWIYTDDNKLKCGDLFLCNSGNNLLVSSSSEYALTVLQDDEDTIRFYSGQDEIFIEYSPEYSSFLITGSEENACTFFAAEVPTSTPVTGITIDPCETEIYKNETFEITYRITPENATDKTVSWQSSDDSVARVENGTVTAVSDGEAVISASTNDGGFTASCTVTVKTRYYKVDFLDMDGSIYNTQQVEAGKSAVMPQDPHHEGYEFLGWSITDISCITSDMQIESFWNTTVFSIEYDLCGGTCEDDMPKSYTIESDTFSLPVPQKNGYEFVAWHKTPDCSDSGITEIEKGSCGDLKLYARYDAITYLIKYELAGGMLPMSAIGSYTIESPVIYLQAPSRRAYDFVGWYDNPDFSGECIVSIEPGSYGNITLYAAWTPHEYFISYECNGGTLNTEILSYNIESATITLPSPVRTGYTFAGWYDNAALSGNSITQIECGSFGDKTFYAAWQTVTYSITYNTNGGSLPGNTLYSYNIESSDITLPTPTKIGYTFCGWYSDPTFSGNAVSVIQNGSYGNKTLYARWDTVPYTITFHANGGTINGVAPTGYTIESESITLPSATRTAYDFGGWFSTASLSGNAVTIIEKGSVGNKNFYAAWTPTVYHINFYANGGTVSGLVPSFYTVETPTIVLPSVSRTGYNFLGWFDNASFTGNAITQVPQGSYGNKSFYAAWQPITYTITYNTGGGIVTGSAPVRYTIESNSITLPSATKTGYTFSGWYDDPTLSGERIYTIEKGSYGNINLYAAWNIVEYSITYSENGGRLPENTVYSYNIESQTIVLPIPVRDGYNFEGWYTNALFTGDLVSEIATGSTGNITLYAKYSPINYTITYELHGGEFVSDFVCSYNIETPTFYLPVPQKTGYEFDGFCISGTQTPIHQVSQGSMGNISVYAKWRIITYTITYHVYDGVMPDEQYSLTYTIESDTIVLPRPTMTGHVFVGWYDNEAFSGVAIREIAAGSHGDRTYYANWRKLRYTVSFFDWDGTTLLSSMYVEYGNAATPPETVPEHYGYRFIGWSEDYSFIQSNLDCVAQYELVEYDVVFVDLDYSIIETQKVKHGYAAIAPEPPVHEDCIFVFWSCDFSCVTSNMTVVAVYRATTVDPMPTSGQRFVQDEYMENGEDYLITVKTDEGLYALTSLCRFESNGLWAMELSMNNHTIKPADPSALLDDAIFHASGTEYEGFSLTSESSGEMLTCESGEFTMCMNTVSHDLFSYRYQNGAWRLYDKTQNVYLKYNEQDGYFETSDLNNASEIILYKHIRIPDYMEVSSPQLGKKYAIVALRPDGKAFALTDGENGFVGTPVDIVDGKLYFNDNIDEMSINYRFIFGDNTKGFGIRSVKTQGFLNITDDGLITTDATPATYWTYREHTGSGNMTLGEAKDGRCLFCDEQGNFSAPNTITHSKILLFERKTSGGANGDVNADGIINTGDATLLLKYVVGVCELYADQYSLSDANSDGQINTGDAVTILKYTVGIIDWM